MRVDELIAAGRLERVPADRAGARALLETARRHLTTTASIVEDDPDAAYAVLYDAARKAVVAHMQSSGLRARNVPGAHEAVALYAAATLAGEDPQELQRMRRFRNRVEYGTSHLSPAQVAHDLGHAQRIVAVVAEELAGHDEGG